MGTRFLAMFLNRVDRCEEVPKLVGDPAATQGSTSWHFAEGFMNAQRAGADALQLAVTFGACWHDPEIAARSDGAHGRS